MIIKMYYNSYALFQIFIILHIVCESPDHAIVHILQPMFLAWVLFLILAVVLWLYNCLIQDLCLHLGLMMYQRLVLPDQMVGLETVRAGNKTEEKIRCDLLVFLFSSLFMNWHNLNIKS